MPRNAIEALSSSSATAAQSGAAQVTKQENHRSWRSKVILILFNVKLIFFLEIFILYFQAFAVQAAIALQTWGDSYHPKLLWTISEAVGFEPRMLSFFAIAAFATSASEAVRLFTLRFCAHYLRWLLGILLQEPRPSWVSAEVRMDHCPTTFGLPSGHAIIAVSVLVPLAWKKGRTWMPKIAFLSWFTVLCVGRVYLGTHSPHDLFLGSSLGLCLVYVIDEGVVETAIRRLQSSPQRVYICVVFLIVGILNSMFWSITIETLTPPATILAYDTRARMSHCSRLMLFSAREGISAVCGFSGVILAVAHHCDVFAGWKARLLASIMFFLTRVFLDLPSIADAMVIAALIYAGTTYILFEPKADIRRPLINELIWERSSYGAVPSNFLV